MNDLDKKLREIIISKLPKMAAAMQEDRTDYIVEGANEAVALVKQAFADEGYVSLRYEQKGKTVTLKAQGPWHMTGQEWYDRFEKEVYKDASDNPYGLDPKLVKAILVTARRAAGLE